MVRRPGPPLGGLVRAITYQAGEQPRTSVEEFRQLVGVTPTEYLRSRINGPNHLRIGEIF